jgi:cytochrome c-type biogenesis protein CcmH
MTAFVIGALVLCALAGAMLWPLRRAGVAASNTEPPAHLAVLQEQLATLDAEHAAGKLDTEQHRLARDELQRRVLEETSIDEAPLAAHAARPSRKLPMIVGLGVALFAVGLYAVIGNRAGLDPAASIAPAKPGEPPITPAQVDAMLVSIAKRLEKPSDDPAVDLQGWTLLARSYASMQRFAEADKAYARAIALAPKDAQLLADRADVLAVLQGQRTDGEPERLIGEALRLDPKNLKALALAGSAAFQRKDFANARRYWQQAQAIAPAGGEFAQGLDRSLEAVASATGETVVAAARPASAAAASTSTASATSSATAATTTAARIQGRVSLAPALAARVLPTDTVFVFARAAEGPRMPLAIVRRTVADLPFTFTLDDSMAMSPQMKLSGFARVVVGARVSRSGQAMTQPGDLRGEAAPSGTRVDDLQLVIDGAAP